MVFKFLRRKKVESELPPLDDLDNIPEFPDLKEDLPSLPEDSSGFPSLPGDELPPLPPFPKDYKPKSIEEIRKSVGNIEPKHFSPEPKPFEYPKPVQREFHEQKHSERFIPKPVPVQRTFPQTAPRQRIPEFVKRPSTVTKIKKMFIEVNHYKVLLNSMGSIKANIVEAGNSLTRIENINKNQKERLEKWQNCLDTIQKKLIQVDKSLFK